MSGAQVALVLLVLVAFVIGWVGRGKRETGGQSPLTAADRNRRGTVDPDADASYRHVREVDDALGAALTSFQAALGLWQIGHSGNSVSVHTARAINTFETRRDDFARLSTGAETSPQAREALAKATVALARLGDGLAAYTPGTVPDAERHRALLGAERALAAARSRFLLAAGDPEPSPVHEHYRSDSAASRRSRNST